MKVRKASDEVPGNPGYGRVPNGGATSRRWSTSSAQGRRGVLVTEGEYEVCFYAGHGAPQHSQLAAVGAACGCPWQQFIVMNDSRAFIWSYAAR